MDKTTRNEFLITLADVNELIEKLEIFIEHNKATDSTINQLLYAYDIKVKLLNCIDMRA